MAVSLPKNSFVRGQWAPDWWYDVDIEGHDHACRLMKNCFPLLSGASQTRGGTEFIGCTKYAAKDSSILKFVFNNSQAYWIEAGDYYFRFYQKVNGVVGQVQISGQEEYDNGKDYLAGYFCSYATTGKNYIALQDTTGNLPTDTDYWYELTGTILEVPTPYPAEDVAKLNFTGMKDFVWFVHPSHPVYSLNRMEDSDSGAVGFVMTTVAFGTEVEPPTGVSITNGSSVEAPVCSVVSNFGSGGLMAFAVSVVTADGESPLSNHVSVQRNGSVITWTDVTGALGYYVYRYGRPGPSQPIQWCRADSAYVTKPYTTYYVEASYGSPVAEDGLGFCLSAFNYDGVESLPSNIVYGSQIVSSVGQTLSWTEPTDTNEIDYYNIYCKYNGIWGFVATADKGQTSYTFPSGDYTDDLAISPDTSKGIIKTQTPFSDEDNYPSVVAFMLGRLTYADTNTNPLQFWGSRAGDFNNFNKSSTTVADDALNYEITSQECSPIRWILPQNIGALLGTDNGVFSLNGLVGDNAFSATTTPEIRPQDVLYGCADMQPLMVGDNAIYADYSKRRFRDISYSIYKYGYAGSDITLRSTDLFENNTAVAWDYQTYPYYTAWIIRDDGKLIGCSYKRETQSVQLLAWHLHETEGNFESVSCIPSSDGQTDTLLQVQRTLNGTSCHCIEYLRQPVGYDDDGNKNLSYSWMLDCAVRYEGAATNTITGLDHLKNETVDILANGVPYEDLVVSADGVATLPNGATTTLALIGIPYKWEMMPMHFEYQSQQGTTAGKQLQIRQLHISLSDTATVANAVEVYPNKPEWQLKLDPNDTTPSNTPEFTWEEQTDTDHPGLFTGNKIVNVAPGNPRDATVYLCGSLPVPVTIRRLIATEEEGGL